MIVNKNYARGKVTYPRFKISRGCTRLAFRGADGNNFELFLDFGIQIDGDEMFFFESADIF